jgi:putative sterol carrier protein
MTPEEVFKNMEDELEKAKGLGAVYQFVITGENGGEWYLDATGDPPVIGKGMHEKPGATFTAAEQDFVDMATGKLASQMAFMMGKLKVSGDMMLAMRLQKIFP